jgi:four helix bundle protein
MVLFPRAEGTGHEIVEFALARQWPDRSSCSVRCRTLGIRPDFAVVLRPGPCKLNGNGIATELMGCGTSVGANAEEAQDGQTKADFIAKLSISRKEARETGYWLRVAIRVEAASSKEVEWELREAGELRAMIVAAIRTARRSDSRGDS